MSQQNVVKVGAGAELVESVPSQTGSPGLNPQHHINWMSWSLSAIPAPWGGRSRGIRSSRAYSATQGAWHQPGMETLSQKPKTKRWLLCIMESSAVDSECQRMRAPFIFMANEIGKIQKPTYCRIPLTQYPRKEKTNRHITGGCLELVGLGIRQTMVTTGFFLRQQNVLVSGNDCVECTKLCWTEALYMGESYDL